MLLPKPHNRTRPQDKAGRWEYPPVTGQGWEMGIPSLSDSSQMEQVIRLDQELWVKLANWDQLNLFFCLCRILQIPFREVVWQACQCLTACYTMAGHLVSFTKMEFSQTGLREGNHPAPLADFDDLEVQWFAVCATLEGTQAGGHYCSGKNGLVRRTKSRRTMPLAVCSPSPL